MKNFFKKVNLRKLAVAILACFMFCMPIVLSGCDISPMVLGGDEIEEGENSQKSLSLDGVKVLRRPSEVALIFAR